ncbi:hypothetical protein GF356_00490, partial [candidate division GN15 bacterium]|nr:hypothetical protein [candidate division GN15 bacterium]
MTHRPIAVCLLTLALIVACGHKQAQTEKPQPATPTPNITLAQLADWMTGSFSSADQAAEDSAFFDIRLEMSRIWLE